VSKSIPAVQQFMSTVPYVINADESLASAHRLMKQHRIRHLPVLDTGLSPVGIVSDGDLFHAEAMTGVNPETAQVRDVMTAKPFTVQPTTPLDEVVEEMAGHKYGSALVVQNGKLVGIFTATDALGAFYALMQTRMK